MIIHTYGKEKAPVIIMLPGSFCNADTMANIIAQLETAFHVPRLVYSVFDLKSPLRKGKTVLRGWRLKTTWISI